MKDIDNYLKEIQEPVSEVEPILMASIATSIGVTAYNFYKDNIAKAARHCQDFKSQEKTKCLLNFKIKATQKLMNDLKAGVSKCKDDKCKAKLMKKVKNVAVRLNGLQNKLRMVMQQKY